MLKHLVLVVLLSTALLACSSKPKAADDTRYVKVFVVGENVSQSLSTFHGNIHAEFEPNLSFRVTGKIISRNADIGQVVKKGEILARLDPTDFKLSEDSANAGLASAKSNYITQQSNLARYKELLKQNFVSQAQFDSQKAQFDSAKAQYKQNANQLANSKNQVQYTSLIAPSDGVISSINNMDAGQVVSAGQVVATMAVSGNKEVEVELPEVQINNYKAGMPAVVKIWATEQVYNGKIRTINQSTNQQTKTYTARVVIANPDDAIKYGMSADVTIQPLNAANGIILPLSSLYAKEGKSYVWLIDKDNKAKLLAVEVIDTDGSSMKVKTGSINYGDQVIAAGTNFIYPGQKLKIYSD